MFTPLSQQLWTTGGGTTVCASLGGNRTRLSCLYGHHYRGEKTKEDIDRGKGREKETRVNLRLACIDRQTTAGLAVSDISCLLSYVSCVAALAEV